MIEESIKAVREAEAKAESLILDAQKNAAEIVKVAQEVLDAAKASKEAGDAQLLEAEAEAAREAASLKASVAPKTEAALKAVIETIL